MAKGKRSMGIRTAYKDDASCIGHRRRARAAKRRESKRIRRRLKRDTITVTQ
jgi:hypothetical protein